MSRPETTTVLWARLFNAITRAIPRDRFVSLSEREAVTAAVWDEVQPEVRRLDKRVERAEAERDLKSKALGAAAIVISDLAAQRDRLRTWPGLMETLAALYPPDVIDGSSGDTGPQIITLTREVDRLRKAARELLTAEMAMLNDWAESSRERKVELWQRLHERADSLRAALDQAPAAEQDGGGQ